MDETKISLKKRWTPEQDKALREIKQNLRYKSWNVISKKMAVDFGFLGRSQKQCRDRYENYLKSKQTQFQWTQVEEEKMFKMFVKEGSRWELISSYFSNIKGIHIKNKFYTRIRKAVRQVNTVIDFYYCKRYEPFEFSIISKLVSQISKNVQEFKYQKRSEDESEELDKYSKTLFQLIELTNQEDYELFPELEIKQCSPLEKKKLYKRLIKSLKKIQEEDTKQSRQHENHASSSHKMVKKAEIYEHRGPQVQELGEICFQNKNQKVPCGYKDISSQNECSKNSLRIISRIRKIKSASKILKEDLRSKQSDQDFEEAESNREKIANEFIPVENNQKFFSQPMDFTQFYNFNQEPATFYDQALQFPNIQFFCHFQ